MTGYADDFGIFYSLSVSAGTAMEKIPKVTRSPSVEFYPHVTMADLEGKGWSFGVTGNFAGLPSTGIAAMFATPDNSPLPDLASLSGLGLSAGASGGSASFSVAGSFGFSFKANGSRRATRSRRASLMTTFAPPAPVRPVVRFRIEVDARSPEPRTGPGRSPSRAPAAHASCAGTRARPRVGRGAPRRRSRTTCGSDVPLGSAGARYLRACRVTIGT